jgi:hypothetical protein
MKNSVYFLSISLNSSQNEKCLDKIVEKIKSHMLRLVTFYVPFVR